MHAMLVVKIPESAINSFTDFTGNIGRGTGDDFRTWDCSKTVTVEYPGAPLSAIEREAILTERCRDRLAGVLSSYDRICVAALKSRNIDHVADAIDDVLVS